MLFTIMTGVADTSNGCHRTTTSISSAFVNMNFDESRVLLYTASNAVASNNAAAIISCCCRKTVHIRSAVVNLHTASCKMLLFYSNAVYRISNACHRTSTY